MPSNHQTYCIMIVCRHVDTLQKRIVVLERDPRVPRLMEVAEEFAAHKKAIAEEHRAVEAKMEVYHNTVGNNYKGRSYTALFSKTHLWTWALLLCS